MQTYDTYVWINNAGSVKIASVDMVAMILRLLRIPFLGTVYVARLVMMGYTLETALSAYHILWHQWKVDWRKL